MITDIIYHILNKEQYSSEGTLDINPSPISPNDAHHKFLDQLNKAYAGRAGKGFGVFDDNEDISNENGKIIVNNPPESLLKAFR
ncbi:hypothetical protein EDL98_11320 [Ornithobacterium rhinotracheale]|uniref:nucleoid-associated protein n=1 Tax=Ornithobacterium rhinotracheale TaxID=28251 RepID=UPI00129C4CF0|nr:nucleoid-associated protein [Ornithobacterium rhinotracheale]MRJ11654.1 hypothetical protein [Ornithobacterium rhinotracheale]